MYCDLMFLDTDSQGYILIQKHYSQQLVVNTGGLNILQISLCLKYEEELLRIFLIAEVCHEETTILKWAYWLALSKDAPKLLKRD